MSRKVGTRSAAKLLALAEELRNGVNALPGDMSGKIRELVLSIINQPTRRRGRAVPRKRRVRKAKPKPGEQAPAPK
ncbi:MAG: hypothetical protein QXO32_03615 [Candidatus Bathyarchaeia archaeon]